MEARPAAETFQLCSWSDLCSPFSGQTVKQAPAFPHQQPEQGSSHTPPPTPVGAPSTCFSPAHILRSRVLEMDVMGQGGIVGAAKHQGVGRGQDKGCCVSSMTISGAGLHRGTAALQGALLLPSVPLLSWRVGNSALVGAGVPGLVGDALCSSCRNQPLSTFLFSLHRCWVCWCGLSSPPQRTTCTRHTAG